MKYKTCSHLKRGLWTTLLLSPGKTPLTATVAKFLDTPVVALDALTPAPARSAPYETASALAPCPYPEVGVETRYSPASDYTGLPQNLQHVVRSLVPSGRSAPGAGFPDMLWYSRMPRPPAGEPRTMGTQYKGFGRVPNCVGISIASSCWQYALP